jgi:hypothetical protein
MVQGFKSGMSSEDLLAMRIRQLDRKEEDIEKAQQALRKSRLQSKQQFEQRFAHRLKQKTFVPGDLVLVRNTTIEKELNRKTKPRYLGPYEVVKRTSKGSYIVKELDGTQSRSGIAGFRLLKYHPSTNNLAELVRDPIHKLGERLEGDYQSFDSNDTIESLNEEEEDIEEDIEDVEVEEMEEVEMVEGEFEEEESEEEFNYSNSDEDEAPISYRTRSKYQY